MKIIAMKESKNLSNMSLYKLFSYLKAHEFEIGKRVEEGKALTSKITILITIENSEGPAMINNYEQLAFLIKRIQKFRKKNFKQLGSPSLQRQQKHR